MELIARNVFKERGETVTIATVKLSDSELKKRALLESVDCTEIEEYETGVIYSDSGEMYDSFDLSTAKSVHASLLDEWRNRDDVFEYTEMEVPL